MRLCPENKGWGKGAYQGYGKGGMQANEVTEDKQEGDASYIGWGGGIMGTEEDTWVLEECGVCGPEHIMQVGLEPSWRKTVDGDYKLDLVSGSGAVRSIVPPKAVPGMRIKETTNTGKSFMVANWDLISNWGGTNI